MISVSPTCPRYIFLGVFHNMGPAIPLVPLVLTCNQCFNHLPPSPCVLHPAKLQISLDPKWQKQDHYWHCPMPFLQKRDLPKIILHLLYIMNMASVFHCCFKGFCTMSKKRIFHYTKACWFGFKMLKFYTESNCFYQGSSHKIFCQHLPQFTGKGYLLICVEKFIWVVKMLLNSSIF